MTLGEGPPVCQQEASERDEARAGSANSSLLTTPMLYGSISADSEVDIT